MCSSWECWGFFLQLQLRFEQLITSSLTKPHFLYLAGWHCLPGKTAARVRVIFSQNLVLQNNFSLVQSNHIHDQMDPADHILSSPGSAEQNPSFHSLDRTWETDSSFSEWFLGFTVCIPQIFPDDSKMQVLWHMFFPVTFQFSTSCSHIIAEILWLLCCLDCRGSARLLSLLHLDGENYIPFFKSNS